MSEEDQGLKLLAGFFAQLNERLERLEIQKDVVIKHLQERGIASEYYINKLVDEEYEKRKAEK